MKQNAIEFLESRGYKVAECLCGDERYRLERGEHLVLDDSACEDFYGSKAEVAEVFADYVKNDEMPEELSVEQALSDFDGGIGYTVVDKVALNDHAKLMFFKSDNGIAKSSAVVYDDGTIFVTDDWQGYYAENQEEVEDYDWHDLASGKRAVIMDGLPRLLN